LLVGALTGLAAACVGDAREDDEEVDAEPDVELRADDAVAAACPSTHIIGRRAAQAQACPNPNQDPNQPLWRVTNLLQAGTDFLAANPAVLAGPLRRYCSYEWLGQGTPPPQQVAAVESSLEEPSRDCQAVFPATGVGLDDLVNPVLTDIWADRIGVVLADEIATSDTSRPVTVMVIDTQPFAAPADGPTMRHGETMARAIEDIACPDGDACTVSVNRVLGLPRIEDKKRDLVHGGFAGTYGDLAAATMEAIRRWETTPNAGRLVLNYSVGWDPEVFDEPGPTQLANLDAIRDALDYARCRGAVIVAAAGNAVAGVCSEGPIAPGLWENAAAPSLQRCSNLGVAAAPTGPLVHAVGGVALDGGDFASSRPGGIPRLVALADHVVVPSAPKQVVSGTSIAAAELTGALALAGRFAPDLTPAQLVESAYQGGWSTGDIADFGRGVPQPVRTLDVCGALLEACDTSQTCTSFANACTPGSTGVPALTDLVVDEPADHTPNMSLSAQTSCAMTCGETTYASHTGAPLTACAQTATDPLLFFVDPQPGRSGCPTCILSENKLQATLGKEVEAQEVQELSVELTAGDGTVTRISLGDVPLEHDAITEIELDAALVPIELRSAEVIVTTVTAPLRGDLLVQ